MEKPIECTFKHASYVYKWSRHSSEIKSNQNKTQFRISETHAGHQPGLGRGTTPPRRGVFPRATFKEKRSGKIWVSLCWWTWRTWAWKTWKIWMLNHNLLLQNLEFSCYEFENMDLGTHTWSSCGNKHKTWFLMQTFGSKQDFFFKNIWTQFSLSKTSFKLMHDVQNRFDRAMQLDKHKEQQE